MLSFVQVDKGRLFFIKLSFEEFKIHGIFISADRSAWPVLKRHQAAKFLKNFQVHFVLYCQENYVFVNSSSHTFYTVGDRLERPDLRFLLNNSCHVRSRFYLLERIHEPNLSYTKCFYGLLYGPFSKNNFFVYFCVFFHWLTLAQNTILRQRMQQLEFNASHINTRITSVNVGKFYRIFTLRYSFWALFDMQLINFIWNYGFSDYSRFEV